MYVRQFDNGKFGSGSGGGANHDFSDDTDLYGNPFIPPGGYINNFKNFRPGNFTSGPSYEETIIRDWYESWGTIGTIANTLYGLADQWGFASYNLTTGELSGGFEGFREVHPELFFLAMAEFSVMESMISGENWLAVGGDGDGKFHFGISHDVNASLGAIGGTFEHGDIFSMPGNYHSYGHTLGFELSYSINLVFIIKGANFQERNFFGGGAEADFPMPLLPCCTIAIGGDNTSNLYNYLTNKPFNSYTMIKIGFSFGGGASITPNSRTKKNYFFYGDPNPRRIYWNPTSR